MAVTDSSGTYNAGTFVATGTVAGVNSAPVGTLEATSPTLTYYSGTSVSGTGTTSAPSTVGTYTVLASFVGSTDYTSGSASTTFSITSATPTVNVFDSSGLFNGSGFAASETVAGVSHTAGTSLETVTPSLTYYSGTSVSGTGTSSAPSTVGTYTVLASFVGSADYTSGSASTTFTISQAMPTVTVSDSGGYATSSPATPYPATAMVAGVSHIAGTSLETVTPSLTYYSGTSVTGTGTTSAPSTVGTYTVLASFVGSTDYTSGSASTTFQIASGASGPIAPPLTLIDASGAYTGAAFTAITASLDGVTPSLSYYSGTSASGTALSGAPTMVGTYTVLASIAATTQYTSGTASTTFSITKALPTVSLTDNSGTFTGSAFTATTASLEGVTPIPTYYSGTSVSGTALSSAPSTVGTYTVLASFAGSTDYSTGSASTTFSISKATPTVNVLDFTGTYNGAGFAAVDAVTGVNKSVALSLENVTPTLTYYSGTSVSGTGTTSAPSTVGTYTVLASFAGSADYTSASASTTISISQAMPIVSVFENNGTFNSAAFTASESVMGVTHVAGVSLENVTPSLSYYAGSSVTNSNLLGSVPTAVGTYTVLASFVGSSDYTSGGASTTFTISQATPTVSVTDNSGTANGGAFTASDAVAGVNHVAGASLENVTPTLHYFSGTTASGSALSGAPSALGTYTVLASFAGSTDYTSGSATTTFVIGNGTTTQPPSLTVPAGIQSVSVAENGSFTISGISATDPSSGGNSELLTLSVANGTITVPTSVTNGVTSAEINGNGTNNVTITASLSQLNATLAAGYTYSGLANFAGSDSLVLQITDINTSLTNRQIIPISVLAPNQPPVVTVPGALSVVENTALAVTGVSVTDVDSDGAAEQVTFIATSGTITLATNVGGGLTANEISNNGTNMVTVLAPLAQLNATLGAAGGLTYLAATNFVGNDTLTIVADDLGHTGTGGTQTSSQSIAITVTNPHPWQNPANMYDVNNDGAVTPEDALIIIDALNTVGPHMLPPVYTGSTVPGDGTYYDVAGGNSLGPEDALLVIDYLSTNPGPATIKSQAVTPLVESSSTPTAQNSADSSSLQTAAPQASATAPSKRRFSRRRPPSVRPAEPHLSPLRRW